MQSEIENIQLPYYLKAINMLTVTDPHVVTILLQKVKDALVTSPNTINLLSFLGE